MIDITKTHVVHDWAYERPLLATCIDPQGRFVVSSAEDGLLQRFKVPNGELEVFPRSHASWVQALAISPDGNRVVSGGGDGRLTWWNTEDAKASVLHSVEDAHQDWIRGIGFSPDGSKLLSGGYDGKVNLWDAASGERLKTWEDHPGNVYSICFFPDNQRFVSGDLLGNIHLRDVSKDEVIAKFDGSTLHSYNAGQRVNFGGIRSLAINADASQLIAGGLHKASNPLGAVHEPFLLRFNISDQQLLKSHIAEGITGGGLWNVRFLSDGKAMGVSGGSTGGFLLFWDTEQEKTVHQFKLPSLARGMDLTGDERLAATAHHDRHLRVSLLAAD